jgi:hypothetical protein
VNNHLSGSSFKKNLGIAACVLILMHILICILVIVLPEKVVYSNFLTSTYRNLMVVGPFFYESNIKSSSHLAIKFYSNGSWSSVKEERAENFRKYQRMPWRYDLLRKNDFEEYAAYQIRSLKKKDVEAVKRSRAFRELNQFILARHGNSKVDSVSLRHFIKVYLPESSSFRYDTIFAYTYSPHEIGPAKR